MSIVTLILFFAYTWGLGFSVTRLVRESESAFERFVMRIGIGLCAFIVLGIILNTLRVPLDWRIFLLVSAVVPLYSFFRNKPYKNFHPSFSFKLRASTLVAAGVLAILAFSVFMYVSGAFKYPYLEDDDPWSHVRGIKYISVEKTAFANPFLNSQYVDPYPPSYDLLLGVLHQSNSSIYWTVKFFNAFLIALSVVFFFFFAKEFLGSRNKALFATFVLVSVPAYLSHFIWAPALAMVVFFPTIYAFEMVKSDKRWWIPAGVGFASLLLVHPTHAAILAGFIAIFLGVRSFYDFFSEKAVWARQSILRLQAVAFGTFLSLFWWVLKWRVFAKTSEVGFQGGAEAATTAIRTAPNLFAKVWAIITRVLNPNSGTATRVYALKDFVVATSQNMINNPLGFGVFVSALAVAGFFYAVVAVARHLPKPKVVIPIAAVVVVVSTIFLTSSTLDFQQGLFSAGSYLKSPSPPSYSGVFALCLALTSLAAAFLLSLAAMVHGAERKEGKLIIIATLLGWLLFAFLGVNNKTFNLPIGLFAFRWWMILAIPVALIAAEGFFAVLAFIGRLKLEKSTAAAIKLAVILVVVAGIFFTSTKPKFDVNTSCWPAGAFWSGDFAVDENSGCVTQSEVLTYSWLTTLPPGSKVFTFSNPDQVIGFDKYSCGWCAPEVEMKKQFYNVTPSELRSFLSENGYEYFVIGGIEVRNFGLNETNRLVQSVAASGLFTIAQQGQAAIVFKTA